MKKDISGTVMLEFKSVASKKLTVDDVCQVFNLNAGEIDKTFGVIPLERPEGQTFLVVVSAPAAERIEKSGHPDFLQNWPNFGIGPA